MTLTQEQKEAVEKLNAKIVAGIESQLRLHLKHMRSLGLLISEYALDLTLLPIETLQPPQQSDDEWLSSLGIVPDLTVREGDPS